MALTFPRPLPECGLRSGTLTLAENVAMSPSGKGAFANLTQVNDPVWLFAGETYTLRPALRAEWGAWKISLQGGLRSFLAFDTRRRAPLAYAGARSPDDIKAGWAGTANVVTLGAGGVLIRAAWEAVDDVTVTGVDVMYFPTAQPDAVILRSVPESQTVALLDGVLSATQYRVRTRLVTDPPRTVAWSVGALVTTSELPDPDFGVYLDQIKGDAYQALLSLRADITAAGQRLDDLVRQTAAGMGAQARETAVAVRAGNANAAALTGLSASVTELDGVVNANAAIVSALSAQVGNIAGEGLWKMEVVAGSGDVVARLVIFMRATMEDAWVEVGTAWETGFTAGMPFSRITNFADQFLVLNPVTGAVAPLFVIDGATDQAVINVGFLKVPNLSSLSVDAGEITTGLIKGGPGAKLRIDITNGTITGTS